MENFISVRVCVFRKKRVSGRGGCAKETVEFLILVYARKRTSSSETTFTT